MKRIIIRSSSICYMFLLLVILGACAETQAKIVSTSTPTARPKPRPTLIPTRTRQVTPTPTPAGACPFPNLAAGLHISASGSYTQSQTEAAGPMICRIERNSCAYYQLVGNLDPKIIFKREEEPPYDKEDILMHPAMLLPLYRLSALVLDEWDGAVHLRITDAYDSLLEHDLNQPDENRKISLHFEGRAIDLTTWPVEPGYYSRLCMLAHCAGFDWVHNEASHCHAAIRVESLCSGC